MNAELEEERSLTTRRKYQKFQPRRAFDLVMRRSMGSASLRQLAVFAVDIARGAVPHYTTLLQWELKTKHCLVADTVLFHRRLEAYTPRHPWYLPGMLTFLFGAVL